MVSLSPSQTILPNPALTEKANAANTLASESFIPPTSLSTVPLAPLSANPMPLSRFTTAGQIPQAGQDQATIQRALELLGNIRNLPKDEVHMQQLGVHVIFRNGQEALNLIRGKGIRVEFGDMGDSPAHAQWIADKKLIMINQHYRNDASPATLYAISEAIYHEAGHAAKLAKNPLNGRIGNLSLSSGNPNEVGDDESSIQEELDCLALNTLAHRYHTAMDPSYAQTISSSRLLSDGVALYARLFFDADPKKQALINRVVEKYGDLPLSSPGHEPPPITGQLRPIAYPVAWRAGLKKTGMPPAIPSTTPQAASPFVVPSPLIQPITI